MDKSCRPLSLGRVPLVGRQQHDQRLAEREAAVRRVLAAGADLSIPRLRQAYSQGIFPWYQEGEPLLWWSLAPRMVLDCDEFKPSHSLRKKLRQIASKDVADSHHIQVRVDTAFSEVLRACSRRDDPEQPGVWITPEMQLAIGKLSPVHNGLCASSAI